MLAAVDGVAFAVPPDVQAPIAAAAARAGKHLMLEKPIATAEAEADELVAAVDEGQVASVVFFTLRFRDEMRAWLADVTARGGWAGGLASWFGSSMLETSPFNTPWRRDKGALWDLAPHVISLLWVALGPVTSVTADGGPGRREPPDPAPRGRGEQHGDRVAERGRGGRGVRGVPVERSRPVGGAAYDARPGAAAEHRAERTRREHPGRADRASM